MPGKECIAMLLAGGQGSRLGVLTKNIPKPAVPFGGKYRIIDFALSNCSNSDLDTVGVLTQYQPFELHNYIGTGQPWDLDRTKGGIYMLPPFVRGSRGEWYKGTANAIYQNIAFIEQYAPKYVLILSGDHVYKMDYSQMLEYHKKKGAAATVGVIEVPASEASRFGIANTDKDARIVGFEEKPKNPKSRLASMGVYIFNWEQLREDLIADNDDPNSNYDFGQNILPKMVANDKKVYAYLFEGYWKDIGTINSLWEANMELLEENPPFNLYDDNWKIYNRNPIKPPHYVSKNAVVTNSIITEGATIYGTVERSVIFAGVQVETGAVVTDSIIFPNAIIKKKARVERAIIGEETVIGENCLVGCTGGATGITVIGEGLNVDDGTSVAACSMLEGKRPSFENRG